MSDAAKRIDEEQESESLRMPDLGEVPAEVVARAVEEAEDMLHPDDEANAAAFREHAKPIGSLIDGAFDLMEDRAEGRAKPVATPWENVNDALGGGLWPGFHVLSGTTGSGKSQWALQVAYSAAREGHPVLYVGLELGHADMVARLAGLALHLQVADSGAHESDLRKLPRWSELYLAQARPTGGEPEAGDALRAKARRQVAEARALAEEALRDLPFYLEVGDANGWSADLLPGRMEEIARRGEAGRSPLVVIDYLQILGPGLEPDGTLRRQDVRERIGRAAYAARMAARDHQAVVLALSSVSRGNSLVMANEVAEAEGRYKGGNNGPSYDGFGKGEPSRFVGLGKESGEIEFSADTVMVMGRGKWSDDRARAYMAIAKIRAEPPFFDPWPQLDFYGGFFTKPGSWDPVQRGGGGGGQQAQDSQGYEIGELG